MSNTIRGYFLAIISGSLYGSLGFFGTELLTDGKLAIETMLFWRFLSAALTLVPFLIAGEENRFLKKHASKYLKLVAIGGVYYTISAYYYFKAAETLGTGLAIVIFYVFPLFVVAIEWIAYKKQPKMNTFFALIFVIGGCYLISANNASNGYDYIGIGLAAFAALGYALYTVQSDKLIKHLPPKIITFLICIGSALCCLMISFVNNSFEVPQNLDTIEDIITIGLVCTSLPILFYTQAMKYISSTELSIISVFEPVVTVIVGVIFLHEIIDIYDIYGILLILAATIIIQIRGLPKFY